jgi:FkbM family methyltransferase
MLRSLIFVFRYIWRHPLASRNRPLAIRRFLAWQISQRLHPRPQKVNFVEDSHLIVEKRMFSATGNIYAGLQEFEDMAFLLHVLDRGDIFVDVGANVGVYTVLAAKNAGASVIAIEPIPSTVSKLERNIDVNGIREKVEINLCGISDRPGTLHFTRTLDSLNRVLATSEPPDPSWTMEVPVRTLDELVKDKEPVLCKIDIEGYELPALQGAHSFLSSPSLKAVIIELNGCGGLFGFDENNIHNLLVSYGFAPYSYEPFSRELKLEEKYFGTNNTIYLKDVEWVVQRLRRSKKYRILNINV